MAVSYPQSLLRLKQPLRLTVQLREVLGIREDENVNRLELTKKFWTYFLQNNLQDPSDRRWILADENLKILLGTKRFQAFSVEKLYEHHILGYVDDSPELQMATLGSCSQTPINDQLQSQSQNVPETDQANNQNLNILIEESWILVEQSDFEEPIDEFWIFVERSDFEKPTNEFQDKNQADQQNPKYKNILNQTKRKWSQNPKNMVGAGGEHFSSELDYVDFFNLI